MNKTSAKSILRLKLLDMLKSNSFSPSATQSQKGKAQEKVKEKAQEKVKEKEKEKDTIKGIKEK